MKLSILLLICLGFVGISFNLSEALQYKQISIGRYDRFRNPLADQRQRKIEESDIEPVGSHIIIKEDPPTRIDGQQFIASLLDALPQLESSLQSSDNRVDYPQGGYYGQYDPNYPGINPIKALLAKLAYGLPVLLGYFKVFTYLNQLCADNSVCTNVTVTATSTITNSATTTATDISVTTSSITRLFSTTLRETTTATLVPTTTTTFTETSSTSSTRSLTFTNTITSTTAETATSTSTSTTTSITITTNTITTTTTTSTMLNNPGRFMEIFGEDDEDIFNFDYRPTLQIDASASPVLNSFGVSVADILGGTGDESDYSESENENIEEEWTDDDTALLSPSSKVVELSSSIETSRTI